MTTTEKTTVEIAEKVEKAGRAVPPARLLLPQAALRRMDSAAIYCRGMVSLEHRQKERRVVLRAVESGGAEKEIGHYALFADERGEPLDWLQPLQSIVANGLHAVVIAEAMISVEMFRYEQTYELLIMGHRAIAGRNGAAALERKLIFRGVNGYLPLDLTGEDARMKGRIMPEFFSLSGERRDLPADLMRAVKIVTAAVNTVKCRKAQFACAPGAVSKEGGECTT